MTLFHPLVFSFHRFLHLSYSLTQLSVSRLNVSSISSLPSSVLCHHHGHCRALSNCYSFGLTISPPWPWWKQDAEVGECCFILHTYYTIICNCICTVILLTPLQSFASRLTLKLCCYADFIFCFYYVIINLASVTIVYQDWYALVCNHLEKVEHQLIFFGVTQTN